MSRTATKTKPTEEELAAQADEDIQRLLVELGQTTDEIANTKAKLDRLYGDQKTLFTRLREYRVTNRRIADAAGISEEAVIQRLRPKKTPTKKK